MGCCLSRKSADDAAASLTSTIFGIVDACVPSKWILYKPDADSLINHKYREALQRKQDAWNTPLYALERDACSSVFLSVYHEYVVKTHETAFVKGMFENHKLFVNETWHS